MRPITIEVPANYIGVLKLFTAKDSGRYSNGIALEIGPKESRLVATGTHWLGVFRLVAKQETVTEPFTVVIPNSVLDHVKPNKGLVSITTTQNSVSVIHNHTTRHGEPIDGAYPKWREVMPKGEVSGQVAQFNPAYIGDLAKAAALLHGGAWMDKAASTISHNGDSAAIIDLQCPDFTGVIMPWKAKAPSKTPAWAFDDLQGEDREDCKAARLYAWANPPKGC